MITNEQINQMAREAGANFLNDCNHDEYFDFSVQSLTAYTARLIELCADKMPEIELTGLETEYGKEVIDRHNQLVRIYRQKILALKPTGKEG